MTDVKTAQIFIKYIPTQVFCAAFKTADEVGSFMRNKTIEQRRDYWEYKRTDIKKFFHMDPNHLKLHPKYA